MNTHTHLELTHLRGVVPESDFFEWIQQIRQRKAATTPDQFIDSAKEGVREAWAGGVTSVADTGDSGAAALAVSELGGRGVVYHEVFGPHPDQADDALAGLRQAVTRLRSAVKAGVTVGVSPHAPYTVSAPLFRRVAEWARSEGLPLAVHLGESRAETAFVSGAGGPFGDLWRRRAIPLPDAAPSPFIYLDRLGVLGDDLLVIHGTQGGPPDAELLARRGVSVTLCPGSNARHGHGDPPVAAYLKAGVTCGVGTDSAASVDRMDLFAEARAAGRLGGLDTVAQLRLMTLDGAAAIGLEAQAGSLDVGKWADLCLCGVAPGGAPDAVATRVLEAGPPAVVATWVGGRLVNGAWPAEENSR